MNKGKKVKLKFYPRELLFAFLIVMLPVSLFMELRLGISGSGYFDEVLGIVSVFYIVVIAIMKGMSKNDMLIVGLTVLCAIVGLIGNIREKLITNFFPVAVDTLCLFKVFFPFLVCKMIASMDNEMKIIKYLLPFAKIQVLIGTLCGIINQFHYIRMSYGTRYGLRAYFFVYDNAARYGYIIACCMLVIILLEKNKIKELIYDFLCIFNMILTTKGVVYIVIVCYFVFLIVWRKKEKFTPIHIPPLLVAGTVASTLQIKTYLTDFNSPRVRFIRYGIRTANRFFPFGSGFATYGSDMASRNYSKLYYQYHFYKCYGLNPENKSFLNDCYLGMVIGQFGYLGLVLYIALLAALFVPLNNIQLMKSAKAMTLAIYIGLIISCVGTAIIKSSIGVFVMAFLGLMCGYSQLNYHKEYDGTNISVHM